METNLSVRVWTMGKEHVLHVYTVEDYSAIRKNETLPFVKTWKELEGIMLRLPLWLRW